MGGWEQLTATSMQRSRESLSDAAEGITMRDVLTGDAPTGTAKANITSKGDKAFAIYYFRSEATTMTYLETTDERLALFDNTTNDSILIGKSVNTVYSYSSTLDEATTYYAIGGTGSPYISVDVSHNSTDPMGEFFKCELAGPYRFEIISWDGVSFCFPNSVAAYQNIFNHPTDGGGLSIGTALISAEKDNMGWGSETILLIHEKGIQILQEQGYSRSDAELEYRHGIIPSSSGLAMAMGASFYSSRSPFAARTLEMYAFAAADASTERMAAYVTSARVAMGYTGDYAPPHLTWGTLGDFTIDNLRAAYIETQSTRENEITVTYNPLETAGLEGLYGAPNDVGEVLNSIYAGMANYLASTYIQSVYTFKTVKMPPLTPHMISPPSLSTQNATVGVEGYTPDATPYNPGSYYPEYYAEVAGFDSPELPAGGFGRGPTDPLDPGMFYVDEEGSAGPGEVLGSDIDILGGGTGGY